MASIQLQNIVKRYSNFTGGSDGVIYNAIALVSFLAFVPILILVILIQKHLSRGLTMGAVKG